MGSLTAIPPKEVALKGKVKKNEKTTHPLQDGGTNWVFFCLNLEVVDSRYD